ncbi:MAG TPA: pyridoxamine 5'-phosphate oxidase family protein [Myxococcota bacterium]|nr:pyridoxamine 5'-phosphate oxidase family protein [Myxococcota bacterium]
MADTRMTRAEREAFLADVRVGVLSIADAGRGPLTVPVWYGYEPGRELWFVTDRDSRKGQRLLLVDRLSLCVQTEQPPYKYVSVEGPIAGIERADRERHQRVLAHRYLGKELGDAYLAAGEAGEESIVVRLRPERWLSVDYAKAFGSLG